MRLRPYIELFAELYLKLFNIFKRIKNKLDTTSESVAVSF